MATHIDDEEQLENLKRWWRENWLALVVGLGIGFTAIGGWEGWKLYRESRATQASHLFGDFKSAIEAGDKAEMTSVAARLGDDFARSPYASAAFLAVAQQAAQDGEWEQAKTSLEWVKAHGSDQGLKLMASLRLARVLWQQGDTSAALAELDRDAGAFAPLYDELRGDIRITEGDRDGARQAYLRALAGLSEQASNRELLQTKLDDLAESGEKATS